MTIASEITRLQGAKSCIKTAIENKGVSVSSSIKLDSYYSCINAIPTAVYLTQQEYDALPSSKLTDGVPYGIMVSGNVSKFIRNGTEYNLSPMFDYIVVGGGATGGIGEASGGSGGGGGGGAVLFGTKKTSAGTSISVVIGQGGQKANGCCAGGDTCFGDMVAKGGCFSVVRKAGRAYLYRSGGTSGSGCLGWQRTDNYTGSGGGGGGAGGEGCEPPSGNLGGAGGIGICGYGGGGGGAVYNRDGTPGTGVDGGGNGNGGNANNYGGGGGGGMCGQRGGTGCQGAVIVCYKENGGSGINCATGGTITTCNGYTVHTFTSNGTFTIVS